MATADDQTAGARCAYEVFARQLQSASEMLASLHGGGAVYYRDSAHVQMGHLGVYMRMS